MSARGVDVARLVRCLLTERDEGSACRLCYGDASVDSVHLQDTILLDRTYCPDSATLREILTAVAGSIIDEEMLPETLCLSCTNFAIASYSFLQLCRASMASVRSTLDALQRCERVPPARGAAVKTLYLVLEGERTKVIVDRSSRPRGKPQALARVLSLIAAEAPCAAGERSPAQLQCEDCGKIFSAEGALRRHLAVHTDSHMCSLCTNTYTTRAKLALHTARAHNDKSYKCADCPKRFGSEYLAEEHRKAMHTYVECGVCGRGFTNKHARRAHQLSHGERWPCSRCSNTFKYKEGLKRHALRCGRAIPSERFTCDDCGKTYSNKGTLVQHMRHQHGDDPLKCKFCGQSFLDEGKLQCHMSSHTGVKRFECEVCRARFSYSTTLTYHRRAFHTGERPYPCDECAQSFITSSVRLVHKRRYHSAPAPLCAVCGERFVTRGRLRRHMKKHPTARCDELTTIPFHESIFCI